LHAKLRAEQYIPLKNRPSHDVKLVTSYDRQRKALRDNILT